MDVIKEYVLVEVNRYIMNDYVPGTWRDTIFADKIKQKVKDKFGLKNANEYGSYAYEQFKRYAKDFDYVSDRLNYFGDL